MADILVAEDTKSVREALEEILGAAGHAVRAVPDGVSALAAFAQQRPDLVLLDVMMPKMSGFDVCTEIRRRDVAVPIIFLSAKDSERAKVQGLGLGADDYISKPFGDSELLARVAAALRRVEAVSRASQAKSFRIGGATVDESALSVVDAEGVASPLQPRELALLKMLTRVPGAVVSRTDLMNRLWGIDYYGNTRTLDQHVANLRKKLGPDADRLETVTRVGYRLRT